MIQPQNMMQLISTIKNGNPQQMVLSMLEQSTKNNPIAQNLFSLAQKGDTMQIEQIARNMAKERGIDYDAEFNNFKHMFGF